MAFPLRQVEGRQRLRPGVPRRADTLGLHFPRCLAPEQCSGQAAAAYMAQVVAALLKRLEAVGKTGPHALRLICRDEEEKGTL